jgi:hypothetical protein
MMPTLLTRFASFRVGCRQPVVCTRLHRVWSSFGAQEDPAARELGGTPPIDDTQIRSAALVARDQSPWY